MFGQASHILNKHYCRSATQTQYVPFSSLLKQLFFASLTPPPPMVSLRGQRFTMHFLWFSYLQGLLLNVKPDVFSVLKVYSVEEIDTEPVAESEPLEVADVDQSSLPSSSFSQSSTSADSVSTEDLELSALLSRSSSEEEGSLQSAAPSPVEAPGTPQSEWDSEGKGTVFGVSKQEEAYVTMSSFYQINKSMQKQWRSKTLCWMPKPRGQQFWKEWPGWWQIRSKCSVGKSVGFTCITTSGMLLLTMIQQEQSVFFCMFSFLCASPCTILSYLYTINYN